MVSEIVDMGWIDGSCGATEILDVFVGLLLSAESLRELEAP
jgi:hypothetical protein